MKELIWEPQLNWLRLHFNIIFVLCTSCQTSHPFLMLVSLLLWRCAFRHKGLWWTVWDSFFFNPHIDCKPTIDACVRCHLLCQHVRLHAAPDRNDMLSTRFLSISPCLSVCRAEDGRRGWPPEAASLQRWLQQRALLSDDWTCCDTVCYTAWPLAVKSSFF